MTAIRMATVFLLVCSATAVLGAGFAHDKNFIVFADDQPTADAVMEAANRFRTQVAQEWLGKELPTATGRTIISVELSTQEDRAFTWPIDSPGRKFHKTWLVTSREKAVGSTLKHEIAHTVFNTQFPEPLPVAIEEGMASLYDDPERAASGRQMIHSYGQRGNWPRLQPILEANSISARDGSAYAVMSSLVEYLLTRGDKPAVLRFAATGKMKGWDQAAHHYHLESIEELQAAWQAWTSQTSTAQARTLDRVNPLQGLRRVRRAPSS